MSGAASHSRVTPLGKGSAEAAMPATIRLPTECGGTGQGTGGCQPFQKPLTHLLTATYGANLFAQGSGS